MVYLSKAFGDMYACMFVCIYVILINKYFKYSIVRALKMNTTHFWLLQVVLQQMFLIMSHHIHVRQYF